MRFKKQPTNHWPFFPQLVPTAHETVALLRKPSVFLHHIVFLLSSVFLELRSILKISASSPDQKFFHRVIFCPRESVYLQ